MDISEAQAAAFKTAQAHGWWDTADDCNIPTKLALVHSEVSEALEEFRKDKMDLAFLWRDPADGKLKRLTPAEAVETESEDPLKPVGFGTEMADIVIRVMDLCEWLSIDLDHAMKVKMAYNETRAPRHGGKKV